jgi:carbonic anhydrase
MTAETDTEPVTGDAPDMSEGSAGSRLGSRMPGRREALFLLGGGLLGATVGGGGAAYALHSPSAPLRDDDEKLSELDGRDRLEAGNARFVDGKPLRPDQSVERRVAVADAQAPFATILSCADSRVPPEVIFDQGLGDLFAIRSAGQVVDRAVLGSLQYAVEHLATPLLVVLGHSDCGTVQAAIEMIKKKAKPAGNDIDALMAAIRPAVVEAQRTGADETNLLSVSIDINVERIVDSLKSAAVLSEASILRKVKIVGATYGVDTGRVSWL